MGKSGESTQLAELEYGDGLGAPDPATPTVTIPRGGLDPWRRGRLPQRRDKAAAVLRVPERRMETCVGRSARDPARAVSGAARKLGWLPGHQERGREGETEGGSPCLLARDCVREGFQALMGLALGVWPRRGFRIVSGGQS